MISVTAATGLLDAITRAGADADRVLRAARLERSAVTRHGGFIPSGAFARLLEEAARATGDACFGLRFGTRFDPQDIGMLAYVVANSPTLAAAMCNVERYLHIHNDAPQVSFGVEGSRGYLRYLLKSAEDTAIRQHNEFSMAVLVKAFRSIAGDAWTPDEIEFVHQPGGSCDYRGIFGCPVRFGSATNALFVNDGLVERTVVPDPKLYRALRHHLDRALAAGPQEDEVLERTRRTIAESLASGYAQLEHVAAKMSMSARTLERRLKARGVFYRELLRDTRHRVALEYLKDKRRSLTEIAFLLGYSEVSAFNRAFKRWTGSTPLESRTRQP